MKFDEHVANYHRQLNEEAIGDFFRALKTKPEDLQQVKQPAFRLENPDKNLKIVYDKLKIEQIAQQQQTPPPLPQLPNKSQPLKVNDIVTGTG